MSAQRITPRTLAPAGPTSCTTAGNDMIEAEEGNLGDTTAGAVTFCSVPSNDLCLNVAHLVSVDLRTARLADVLSSKRVNSCHAQQV